MYNLDIFSVKVSVFYFLSLSVCPVKDLYFCHLFVLHNTNYCRLHSRIDSIANGHPTKSRSRSIGIPMPNRYNNATTNTNTNGKQQLSLISGLGIDDSTGDKLKSSPRTNYAENLLLQNNNNRNRVNLPPQQQPLSRGQIYSKKSSMDDLLTIKHLSVSPPKTNQMDNNPNMATSPRRVPISRISLKYLRPSLASSTNSLSSVNHSIASSTSSLSDHNNNNNNHNNKNSSSRSCLRIDAKYS